LYTYFISLVVYLENETEVVFEETDVLSIGGVDDEQEDTFVPPFDE